MPKPILLYSTNTLLAYRINEKYYRQMHYVWCSAYFDSQSLPSRMPPLPPSSCPGELYHAWLGDVLGNDKHSALVQANRLGLIQGAAVQSMTGTIDAETEREIVAIINNADVTNFMPLVYVIPYQKVAKAVEVVAPSDRANPLHDEYIIARLPRHSFDVIELRRR